MIRHKRKIHKKGRGTRSVFGGRTKHRRGRGSRRTNSGSRGRNKQYLQKYEPERFLKGGFNSRKKKQKAVNLIVLEKLAENNEVDVMKHGYDRVIGGGKLAKPLKIKARSFSTKAKGKIEAAGGKAIVVGEGE